MAARRARTLLAEAEEAARGPRTRERAARPGAAAEADLYPSRPTRTEEALPVEAAAAAALGRRVGLERRADRGHRAARPLPLP